jgi:hypothetical protein
MKLKFSMSQFLARCALDKGSFRQSKINLSDDVRVQGQKNDSLLGEVVPCLSPIPRKMNFKKS